MTSGIDCIADRPAVVRGLAFLRRAPTRDTAWALVDQGTSLIASMLSFLLLGRTLGPAGYGAFIGLYALMGPFLSLSQSGVFLAALEHVVREGEEPVAVARSFVSMALVNAAIWVPALGFVGVRWIGDLPALAAILILGAEFFLNGVISTAVGVVQAVTGFAAAARLRMLASLARIGLLATLAAAGALNLTTLGLGQTATLMAVLAWSVFGLSRRLGATVRPGRIRWRHVRSALLYGLGIGASMAQADGDKFVLNVAHHQADAGRYGAAYRLMGIALLPVSALAGATHVSFLDSSALPTTQMRRALRLSAITLAYAVPAVVTLVAVAPWIPRFLTKDFAETTYILRMLAPVVILRGVGVFPMNGLMGLGRNSLRTALLVGHAFFSLVLYAALIPAYSWRGALLATLVTEVSLSASGWIALYLCQRQLPRPPHVTVGG